MEIIMFVSWSMKLTGDNIYNVLRKKSWQILKKCSFVTISSTVTITITTTTVQFYYITPYIL